VAELSELTESQPLDLLSDATRLDSWLRLVRAVVKLIYYNYFLRLDGTFDTRHC